MSFESPPRAEPAPVNPHRTRRSAGRPTARAHTGEEVEQAIRALSPGEFKKLRAAAYALVRGFDLETAGRDHEDLYSEAVARTLNGSRSWRQGVDFLYHLTQAMRSIAWTWREAEDRRAQAGFVASPPPEQYNDGSEHPMDPASPLPDIETAYLTSRELARFYRKFRNDRAATVMMIGWQRGYTMKEMAPRYGISTQDLQWAARRIRRFAQKTRQGDAHDRGDTHGH